jgi:RNA polymerase sigma-70 factor (ECF subfamily)
MMTTPIEAARKGNADAFARLYDEHHLPLFRFAWRLTGSIADAEDIVQECFLALLRPDCSYDAARTPLRTYLFGAVRNQALKRFRSREDAADPPSVCDRRSPESEALQVETANIVAAAIRALPDLQREVLILAHYEQLTLAEIAAVFEIEVTAVKSRLQRARATLREALAEHAGRTHERH